MKASCSSFLTVVARIRIATRRDTRDHSSISCGAEFGAYNFFRPAISYAILSAAFLRHDHAVKIPALRPALTRSALSRAKNHIAPGAFVIENPTLTNLGFEWHIAGDGSRNAGADVQNRKRGAAAWKQAMPLLRLQRERINPAAGAFDAVSPNMFAGGILDLEPAITRESRFVLTGSDGLQGQTAKSLTKTVTVRTRSEPKPAEGGRTFHVYPRLQGHEAAALF